MSSEISLGIDLGSLGIRAAAICGGQIVNLPYTSSGDERFPNGITVDMLNKDIQFSSVKNQLEKNGTVYSSWRALTPAEFLTHNFLRLKQLAEYYFDSKIGQVAIAVPASYPEARRAALVKIAEKCGLKKPRLISDPAAALIDYSTYHSKNGTFLIIDSGFSQTGLAVIKKNRQRIQTLSYGQIEKLSGKFLDTTILKGCLQAVASLGLTVKLDDLTPQHWLALQRQVQLAKENLNTHRDVHLFLAALNLADNIMIPLTRTALNGWVEKVLGADIKRIDESLKNAQVDKNKLTNVLVSGGCMRMDSIFAQLQNHLPEAIFFRASADNIARGAAAFAANILRIKTVDSGVQLKTPENTKRSIGYDFLDLNIIRTPAFTGTISIDLSPLFQLTADGTRGGGRAESNFPGDVPTPSNANNHPDVAQNDPPDLAPLWDYANSLSAQNTQSAKVFLNSIKSRTDDLLQKIEEKPRTNWRIKKAFELIVRGKCEAAVQQSHKAHNANKQDPLVFEDMIKVHIQAASQRHDAESYSDEIRWLECARAHDEGNLEVWQLIADRHYLHALHLQKTGDHAEALTTLAKCLRFQPGHKAALTLQSQLTAAT